MVLTIIITESVCDRIYIRTKKNQLSEHILSSHCTKTVVTSWILYSFIYETFRVVHISLQYLPYDVFCVCVRLEMNWKLNFLTLHAPLGHNQGNWRFQSCFFIVEKIYKIMYNTLSDYFCYCFLKKNNNNNSNERCRATRLSFFHHVK